MIFATTFLIQLAEIPQQRRRIRPALPQLPFHQLQIRPYKSQIEHKLQITSAEDGHPDRSAAEIPPAVHNVLRRGVEGPP